MKLLAKVFFKRNIEILEKDFKKISNIWLFLVEVEKSKTDGIEVKKIIKLSS